MCQLDGLECILDVKNGENLRLVKSVNVLLKGGDGINWSDYGFVYSL